MGRKINRQKADMEGHERDGFRLSFNLLLDLLQDKYLSLEKFDNESYYNIVAEHISRVFHLDAVVVGITREFGESDEIFLGIYPKKLKNRFLHFKTKPNGITKYVEGLNVLLNETSRSNLVTVLKIKEYQSLLVSPISIRDDVKGFVALYSKHSQKLKNEEKKLLYKHAIQAITAALAIARQLYLQRGLLQLGSLSLSPSMLQLQTFDFERYVNSHLTFLSDYFGIKRIILRGEDESDSEKLSIWNDVGHEMKVKPVEVTKGMKLTKKLNKLKSGCYYISDIRKKNISYQQRDFSLAEGCYSLFACRFGPRDGMYGMIVYHKEKVDGFTKSECRFLGGPVKELLEKLVGVTRSIRLDHEEFLQEQRDNTFMESNFALFLHDTKGYIVDPPQILFDAKKIIEKREVLAGNERKLVLESLDIVLNDLNNASEYIQDALDVRTRFSVIKDIRKYIGKSIRALIEKYINIHFSLLPSLPSKSIQMKGDATKLRHLFFGIVDNACKAIEIAVSKGIIKNGEGKISITVSEVGHASAGLVCIVIKDNGVGMSKKQIDVLYRKNVKSSFGKKRTGVGLIFCRDLVWQHGGNIECNSTYRKGTTFRINLPKGKDI